jgi:hypothetical protein
MLKIAFLLISFWLFGIQVMAQGCSDAGFCTMGAMKPDQTFERRINIKLRSITVGHYTGLIRFGDVIYQYITDVSIGINQRNFVQVKLPYTRVDGVLANTSGWSDLTLSFTRQILYWRGYELNATLGTKIPTGESNLKTAEGRTLPMYNQPGLGTYDLILGASLVNREWMFAFGYQQGFGAINNSFLWSSWEGHPDEELALAYPQGRRLQRGTDLMLRVERNFRFTNWNVNLGLLPIYRLNNDVIELPLFENDQLVGFEDREMLNSKGMALTFLLGGGYRLSVRSAVKLLNGVRVIRRERNPDGLSRKFVSNISYEYRF